ncbi:AsnC family transcriptional regulator [Haloarcula salinisoli]|uniref:AsnC family transcriptional regulator n=1 Tax=Haloarcula salinisoli TaxID=2487746 RepID=A0A8J7YPV2_9EURY|nr:AsnC family transcriptional regulator [Halomicroarcula salinisoli]MBX0287317.1 AsnC family transcriptional regulator [Halomicroarcula salinisoli]MBX0305108.1 AsnC family transcriptional regulator [Halomicroarcula salinisoli]
MPSLDETDIEILRLLSQDARRTFTDIAAEVDMSGPAVADRVERLQAAGVIERFTVDIDRTQLGAGAQLFVQVDPKGSFDLLRSRLDGADAVEHVMVTADGELWFNARAEVHNVHPWLRELLKPAEDAEYTVTLLDEIEWQPSLDGTEFALTCAECGNTVDSEGESEWLDEEMRHFCCSTCQRQFEERLTQLREGA